MMMNSGQNQMPQRQARPVQGQNQAGLGQALQQIMKVITMLAQRIEKLEQMVGGQQQPQQPQIPPQPQGSYADRLAERSKPQV